VGTRETHLNVPVLNQMYAFQRHPFVFASCVSDTGNGWDNCYDNGAANVTYVSFKCEQDAGLPTELCIYGEIILHHQMRMGAGIKVTLDAVLKSTIEGTTFSIYICPPLTRKHPSVETRDYTVLVMNKKNTIESYEGVTV
jgi:hypothetical protein